MKKKILCLLTTLVMAVSLIGVMPIVSASAAEVSGDYMYELLYDGTVEITYYAGNAVSLTIPSTLGGRKVTSIGECAFAHSDSLISVTIPNSITNIGMGAFSYCESLTNITLSSKLTNISDCMFYYCEKLTNVIISKGVTSIGNLAFSNCTNLKSVTIPNSVVRIGDSAFSYCESLISVTIPNSVISIGNWAFYLCESLKSVTIPGSVASIPALAFAECYDLASVTISNGVINIEKFAFAYCDSLKSVTIPNSVTSIYNGAFDSCKSLKSITIPGSVTSIGYHAFGCMSSPDDASDYYKLNGFKIYCYAGTAGYNYAKDNGFKYEVLDRIGTVSGFKTSAISSTAVKLTWNKVSGAQGYIVYKYDNAKKTWVRVAKTTTTANTYTVSKLASGTSYKFAVKAYKTVNGKEITSSSFPTVTTTTLLPTVTGFKTSAISSAAVKLTWNKTAGAQGYIVYKYDNAKKTWVRVAKTKTTANTYTVSKLASGTSYKFAVKPYKTVNGKEITSSSFPTVTAITKLPAVVNGATTIGKNSVKLTWKKTTGAQGYIIYKYNPSTKTWARLAKTKSLNYLVKSLKSNSNYKFAVKAYKNVSGKEITSVSFKTISVKTKK